MKHFVREDIFIKVFLILILFAQIFIWSKTNHIKPDMIIVPKVISKNTAKIISLGDEQFYFRYLTFRLQIIGDSWGRWTALKKYDYQELAKWFYLLDQFDHQSNFVPSIASYYYSQTQNKKDNIYIVNYLVHHSEKDLANKWWWLTQAVYIANHKLNDKKLALEIAYKLKNMPMKIKTPLWVRQMPAFLHEQLGEYDAAQKIIVEILENWQNFTEGELNFMEYFLNERLKNPNFFKDVKDLIKSRRANSL